MSSHNMMDKPNGNDCDGVVVAGFESPKSPDSSYNNPPFINEGREPPVPPSHLDNYLVNYKATQDEEISIPVPQNAILNHLYVEDRGAPASVLALGCTHRFRSKFVTVVLYKPAMRKWL